uniref:DNA topoisomerase n=1 Tax=Haemonchus contortus TaxID=6289 RepID=A0A7I4Y9H7_HAECO
MRKVLCVAEKNDVAKGVASILSKGQMVRREGRSVYNKIYQLDAEILGQRASLSITSVSGHLMEHAFGPEMKNWTTVPIGTLFDAPIYSVIPDGMKNIARTLKEESAKSDVLVIWTDCDREGESIGAEIAKVCLETNRQIDVYRAKFSEITPRAIENAARHLTRLDQKVVDAVDCRSQLDLRIGAAFTRLQTLHLQERFASLLAVPDGKRVVSYGSCQFPTLGFVVERYKAIERFVVETFWKLVVEHKREDKKAEFTWDRVRLFDQDIVQILYDDCMEARAAKIETVTSKPKTNYRPQPLDTVQLEKLAVRKLRMSAKQAMDIAEKLYNKGYISYPRTETNKFPKNMDLSALVRQQTTSPKWGDFAAEAFLEHGPNPRNGTKSDEAHPPIHPLKHVADGTLQGNDWRLYELVVRHFLACISWDAKGQETRVGMRIGGETFHATGLCVQDLGYLRVYIYDKWGSKVLPIYVEGEELTDYRLRIADGQTQPPELLNEADLIALMDKYGIGTDATHSEHIEKIKTRQYVGVRDDGRFIPGFLGLALVDGYDAMGYAMSKPQLRADLERQLQAICAGERTKQEVLTEQLEKYRRIFVQTEAKISLLSEAFARYLNSNSNGLAAATANIGRGGDNGGRRRGATSSNRRTNRPSSEPMQVPDHAIPLDVARQARGRGTRSRGRGARASNNFGDRNGSAGRQTRDNGTGTRQCTCGLDAVQRTVQKEGQNKGKKFWTCSKPMGQPDKCNFFEWV